MAGFAHGKDMGVQQAALAKAAWRREADRDPVGRCALQSIELRAPVDQMRGVDWPLIIERIHRTSVYGNPGQQGQTMAWRGDLGVNDLRAAAAPWDCPRISSR